MAVALAKAADILGDACRKNLVRNWELRSLRASSEISPPGSQYSQNSQEQRKKGETDSSIICLMLPEFFILCLWFSSTVLWAFRLAFQSPTPVTIAQTSISINVSKTCFYSGPAGLHGSQRRAMRKFRSVKKNVYLGWRRGQEGQDSWKRANSSF